MTDKQHVQKSNKKQDFSNIDFKNLSYAEQFTAKQSQLKSLLSPYYDGQLDTFSSPERHYRMRAEFRIWHAGEDTYHIMFDQNTKQQYRVDQLPAASELINHAMQALIDFLCNKSDDAAQLRGKLFQIDYLSSCSGELVISMLYHKQLDEQWLQAASNLQLMLSDSKVLNAKVSIIGRARKLKRIIGVDHVNETLQINQKTFSFMQVENSFTQPNAHINIDMIEWVTKLAASPQSDLLELYCGAGNFSVPLSLYYNSVLATEISKTSVAAAQENIARNHVENLTIARLSSEEFVEAYAKTRSFNRLANINLDDYNFKTVLVDPPRAGLDDGTLALVSQFDTIVYISCNPNTLIDNLSELHKTHDLCHAALFDQFPFTAHMESGVILRKR